MPPLISFDIDGTLEVGDPPGLVSVEMVRECKRLGYLIGSCSDRPVSYQRQLWERLDIAADFTVLKHRLADVRLEIDAEAYFHIGDTDLDDFFARRNDDRIRGKRFHESREISRCRHATDSHARDGKRAGLQPGPGRSGAGSRRGDQGASS